MKLFVAGLLLLAGVIASSSARADPASDPMRDRWLELWARLQEKGAHGDEARVYRDLVARYGEPHRAYHTLVHVDHVLGELDAVRALVEDSDGVEFALWFHDVVYDIGAEDNEEKSARLARESALVLGLSDEWADRVSRLVLSTRHGVESARVVDAVWMVDLDLAILGQPRERFDAYETAIRTEYSSMIAERGVASFNAGRARILQRFLDQPRIYATEPLRRRYEEQARANLRHSIGLLEREPWTEPANGGQNRRNQ